MFQNKKYLSRGLSLLLCAVLLFGMMSVTAFAGEQFPPNTMRAPEDLTDLKPKECETGGFWGQKGIQRRWVEKVEFHDSMKDAPKNVLNFSAVWKNKDVIGWYSDHVLHIAANGKVVLGKSAAWMFAYFKNLEEVAFNGCVDTSRVENMACMFYECRKLEKVDVECFDTSNVKNMNCMFYQCKSVQKLDVSKFDTSNVKKLRRMFAYCESVKELDVSKFDTSGVTDLSFLFYCCKNVKKLDVSGFDTSANLYLNSMFYHCESLEELDVSHFDTSKTMGMCYTFAGCSKLKNVDVSGFDTSKVTLATQFMDDGVTVKGRPWQELFEK